MRIYSFEAHKVFQLFVTVGLVCIQYTEITHCIYNRESELHIACWAHTLKGKPP